MIHPGFVYIIYNTAVQQEVNVRMWNDRSYQTERVRKVVPSLFGTPWLCLHFIRLKNKQFSLKNAKSKWMYPVSFEMSLFWRGVHFHDSGRIPNNKDTSN